MRNPSASPPGELATPLGGGQLSRAERYLVAVGLQVSSLAIVVAERLPMPDRHRRHWPAR
jgi:hypothetical protein